jgi:hypothetical protein
MLGIRDQVNGNDRIASDFIDARLSGGLPFDQILSRILAMAWRHSQGSAPIPVMTLKGWVCGGLHSEVFEVSEWCQLADTVARADGGSSCRSSGASVRRMRVRGDSASQHDVFGIGKSPWASVGFHSAGEPYRSIGVSDCAAGTLTAVVGNTAKDSLLWLAAKNAGLDDSARVVILFLFMPDAGLAPARQVGGPVINHWRAGSAAIGHIAGSHMTDYVARASEFAKGDGNLTDDATWNDQAYRDAVYSDLSARLTREPTVREFYDEMADRSALRTILTPGIINAFPELEQVFHCIGDPTWDEMSPMDRYRFIAHLTKIEEAKGISETDVTADDQPRV